MRLDKDKKGKLERSSSHPSSLKPEAPRGSYPDEFNLT